MAMACGCRIEGGYRPTVNELKVHAKHTIESTLFWELLIGQDKSTREKLMTARLSIQDALDALAPGWYEV